MARAAQDSRLNTRSSRRNLSIRREPYWRTISEGSSIGYRKGKKGGTWIARRYCPDAGRTYHKLGAADDLADSDGLAVLSFSEAQERARAWFSEQIRIQLGEIKSGPYTVLDACRDHIKAYEKRGGKSADRMTYIVNAHIEPTIGPRDLKRLRRSDVENWLHGLAEKPKRLRTRQQVVQKFAKQEDSDEAKRKRRASANRCFNVLIAALNHAQTMGRVSNKDAWQGVKRFREVDLPVIRHLRPDEAKRLVNACAPDFRPLVQGALLTGCRYGELVALKALDYDPHAKTILVRRSKNGKARHVVLTDEGDQFFRESTNGIPQDSLIFTKKGGAAWGKSHQQRPLKEACKRAKIEPAIRFHDLRHTYGSTLAQEGVSLIVIADQLGHSDTRITERHYAHLSPSYVAETVRANFPNLGIVGESNVERMALG